MSDSTTISSLDHAKLPPSNELYATRLQVEKELEYLTSSHQQLLEAKAKCLDNIAIIDHLSKISKGISSSCFIAGQEMLIPITNSMFLPASLVDNDHVTTDIGTGFMVGQSKSEAQDHFKRKIDIITENLKKVEGAVMNKQNALKCTAYLFIA